uniref:bifunctional aminoglycoside phosphotransferase/ATP-binding protein n=1 Tax=Aquabacterium sp. TaxID=1872578 RepID=UPI003783A86F
ADIGFLVMDLLAHERRDLAFRFLDRYLGEGGDHAGTAVLRYYLVYRALVRALVATLRPGPASGPDYLGLALRWLQPPGARLMITHGYSGSGKSHAAAALLEQAGAIRLRSDLERKRLHGLSALQRSDSGLDSGLYAAQASQATYARLAALASIALRAGWPVIVDAAFLQAAERERFRQLAREQGVPFTILHCEAPPQLLRERLAARARRADDPSEADAAVLAHQLAHAEPLDAREQREQLCVDSARPDDPAAWAALAATWAGAACLTR